MNIMMLLASFGGGLLGACIGGVPAFVMLGLTILAAMFAGPEANVLLNDVALGPWFCTHFTFCGAVAASAYLAKKKISDNGMDIVTPLFKYQNSQALIVGGIFGMASYVIQYALTQLGLVLFNNGAWTDVVALAVVINNALVRLIFGRAGLVPNKKPLSLATGKRLSYLTVIGAGVSLVVCAVTVMTGQNGLVGDTYSLYLFNNMGTFAFGIAAIIFILIPMGYSIECLHQVIVPASTITVTLFAHTQNALLAISAGVIMGILGSLLNEFFTYLINTYADTHVDPPALTITLLQFINCTILVAFL